MYQSSLQDASSLILGPLENALPERKLDPSPSTKPITQGKIQLQDSLKESKDLSSEGKKQLKLLFHVLTAKEQASWIVGPLGPPDMSILVGTEELRCPEKVMQAFKDLVTKNSSLDEWNESFEKEITLELCDVEESIPNTNSLLRFDIFFLPLRFCSDFVVIDSLDDWEAYEV